MTYPNFIGIDTDYPLASGGNARRIHLDGAASPLASAKALETIEKLLPHYSNTHSYVHSSAQISTQALAWAYSTVLNCCGADQEVYTAIFNGAGVTACINRIARGLAAARPQRKVVLVSAMEHHANDLPHRQFDNQVDYINLSGEGVEQGIINIDSLQELLEKHKGKVNYVTISSVSNVTGVVNPVSKIAKLAHHYGAYLVVDGAQAVAHGPTQLSKMQSDEEPDFFVFSGHKVYTPMAPGVMIAKKSVLRDLGEQDLGGGSVASVSYFDYQLLENYPDKEQSGTPNIVGAIALAAVMQELSDYGFGNIQQHDHALMVQLQESLLNIPEVIVYGAHDTPRVGALAFNIEGIDHGLVAAILNDYYAIAVRNECFCAHPYVSSMMKESLWQLDLSNIDESKQQAFINLKRGMVRTSVSLYNTEQDIQSLCEALSEIIDQINNLRPLYQAQADGSYTHKTFKVDWTEQLKL